MRTPPTSHRRAHRAFWALTLLAVAAMGSLSAALGAPTGTMTGIRVAVSGLVLVVAAGLAARIMLGLDRARRNRIG